ncbi:hypothetical protein HWI79_1737 [Cryptosporidium felis]|nr:hypothetical protein HWI79_1737 [Cryptosporidium felis]
MILVVRSKFFGIGEPSTKDVESNAVTPAKIPVFFMSKITKEEREAREIINKRISKLAQQEKWLESFKPKRSEKQRKKVKIKKKSIKIVKGKKPIKQRKTNPTILKRLKDEMQRTINLYGN